MGVAICNQWEIFRIKLIYGSDLAKHSNGVQSPPPMNHMVINIVVDEDNFIPNYGRLNKRMCGL
jgi:hypothetical protein